MPHRTINGIPAADAAIRRARHSGGMAALRGLSHRANPYHAIEEPGLYAEWQYLYWKVTRDLQAAELPLED